jgi:hypothetical protein
MARNRRTAGLAPRLAVFGALLGLMVLGLTSSVSGQSVPASSATPSAPAASGSSAPPPFTDEEPKAPEQPIPSPQPSLPQTDVPTTPPTAAPSVPADAVHEPRPPTPVRHWGPLNALWIGARGGVLFPSGSLYKDDNASNSSNPNAFLTGNELASTGFASFAGPGPSGELDLGARFARHFIAYVLWEHGWLWKGNQVWSDWGGGNQSASTDLAGAGMRWSSNPDRIGVAVDLALGYRWLRSSWQDGTSIVLKGFGESRLGIGADIRVHKALSLSPMFNIGVGTFSDRNLHLGSGGDQQLGDRGAAHTTIGLTFGAHFDVLPWGDAIQ